MKKWWYIIMITILGYVTYLLPGLMISPGALGKSHHDLRAKCASCHQPFAGVPDQKCISCHELSSIGIDTLAGNSSTTLAFHQFLQQIKCAECHTDHNGSASSLTLQQFDHSLLPVLTKNDCARCHVTPTDDLHQLVKMNCGSCHNTVNWRNVQDFNHGLLDSAVLTNCKSCHQPPADDYHRQLVGSCSMCHSTSQWKPSTFDHSSFFILDNDHNVECATCHPAGKLQAYTCYGCHEHTRSEMIKEHDEVNVTNLDDCAACHMSADEDDIRSEQRNRRIENYVREKNGRKKDRSEDDDDD